MNFDLIGQPVFANWTPDGTQNFQKKFSLLDDRSAINYGGNGPDQFLGSYEVSSTCWFSEDVPNSYGKKKYQRSAFASAALLERWPQFCRVLPV